MLGSHFGSYEMQHYPLSFKKTLSDTQKLFKQLYEHTIVYLVYEHTIKTNKLLFS